VGGRAHLPRRPALDPAGAAGISRVACCSLTERTASGWAPIRTCCAMRWRRRWRPTRNRPASSPCSCVMPMAARSPSGSTFTSSRRPLPGWPG
jgi:hypothetical protein